MRWNEDFLRRAEALAISAVLVIVLVAWLASKM
jgi:hypothetical protein